MSTTTDAREALFTGKDDGVRSIYNRLLEVLQMPYRILCNGVQREGVKVSPYRALGVSVIHRYIILGLFP